MILCEKTAAKVTGIHCSNNLPVLVITIYEMLPPIGHVSVMVEQQTGAEAEHVRWPM
jgi:hypothetical protein